VQGPALGGGFELALACDAILAAADSYFALPEINLGLVPGGGGTQRLARLLGRTRVKELVMTGKQIPAPEALALGIANALAPAGEVVEAALAYAETLAAKPPLAVQWAKRLVNQGPDASLSTALTLEQVALAGLFVTEDGREGIRAFVEKRKPQFEGK
jgi:enoyl-CoA hydratase/carnithine racemase